MKKWIEGWYWSYALLGVSAAGLLPILMPLSAASGGSAALAGVVMAAFSLGGLAAPLFGGLADRKGLHRAVLMGGLGLTAAASVIFPLAGRAGIIPAFFQGAGIAAASTAANLFIVETHPKAEWDSRIGWLQTFYGVGQVAGLLLAGALSAAPPCVGVWTAAGLSAAAIIPAALFTPTVRALSRARGKRPVTSPARHPEWPAHSPHRSYHHADAGAFKALASISSPSLWIFLAGWFLSYCGSAAFFSLYPVVMGRGYGVAPGISSVIFAAAAGLGLLLYIPAGKWTDAGGPRLVLEAGLAVRLGAYLLLTAAIGVGAAAGALRAGTAMVLFPVVVLAWSPLSVAGTALTAEMAPRNEGEGIGIFNAMTAAAGMAGALLGGGAAAVLGYTAVPAVAGIGAAAGMILLVFVRAGARRTQAAPRPAKRSTYRPRRSQT